MGMQVREKELRAFLDEENRFIGRALRHTPVYSGEDLVAHTMLIAPLYIEKDNELIYVDHAWIQFPEHLLPLQTYIFDFNGVVKLRKNGSGKVYIEFKEVNTITKYKDEYEGVTMKTLDARDVSDVDERRNCFSNHSLIMAYEMGQELPKKKTEGDGTKGYLQLMLSIKNGRHQRSSKKLRKARYERK